MDANEEYIDIREGWMEGTDFHVITFENKHIIFSDVFLKSYSMPDNDGVMVENINVEVSSSGN